MRATLPTFLFAAVAAIAQTPESPAEAGIPVTNATVRAKCSGCHRDDGKGSLTRISWERTTPEGWQQIIKRMVRLNGLVLTPAEAKEIVKALSETHGLAPEEAAPVAWFLEKRQIETEEDLPDTLRDTCAPCHPAAQPKSWRRSKEEWNLLASMHRGYFPVVDFTSFRRPPSRRAAPGSGQPDSNAKEPIELAIEEWAKRNPLHTREWADWQASRRTPRLGGRWIVSAYRPGKGKFTGEVVIEPVAGSSDEFSARTTLTSISTGETVRRTSRAIVYTGYAWRGRGTGAGGQEEREVMAFSRDQRSAKGRWFWGGYQEFGYDVFLQRADDGPVLSQADVWSLQAGSKGNTVTLFGDQLPQRLTAAEIDFGLGAQVTSIVSQSPGKVVVKVDVDATAAPGRRDVALRRSVLPAAYSVYKQIDFIRLPASAIARLGGRTHPKGHFQFEAIAYSNGIDGKPNTSDDVPLGPVGAQWSIEEFLARYGDDDKEFVGSLGADGLFTPAGEGPNPQRKFLANNFGDVWVVASYTPAGSTKPLTARSYLVVTVPQYMRWDQPEVAQ